MRALVRQTSGHAGETNGCVSYTLCHTHCVILYVNNGGKHTDDDLDRVGSPPDFGKSLGVCWETWLMMIMTRSVLINFDCRMHEKV